ncbi:MAG TPA: hypothetical protein PLP57_07255 [Candidatus Saccharicenans sp.]|jgi:hypothetical protein|nr:hypothetical protein [Candidatus Saccharicenans sp.]HRD02423.1 hypothetical protein [Candidatus Saccharicenans sp.]
MEKTEFIDKKRDKGKRKFASLLFIALLFGLITGLVKSASSDMYSHQKNYNNRVLATNQQKKKDTQKEQSREARTSSRHQAGSELLKENRFLEEELTLAKKPIYYFVIDLKDKKIELRARGMVLKSWVVGQIRYFGEPVPLKVIALSQKSALNPPKRRLIKPGEGDTAAVVEPAPASSDKENKKNSRKGSTTTVPESSSNSESFELEALEITDMPGSYELIFNNGLEVAVRSGGEKQQKLNRLKENLSWHIFLPVKNFLKKNKNLNPKMILYFDEIRDAQGIYWAFIDDIQGIIWIP